MTTKKKTVKNPKKATKSVTIAGRGSVFQFRVNDAVVVEVGQGRGCIGRVMSLDPPNGYVKVRLGGSTHYQYAPENLRHLDIPSDLAADTHVAFDRVGATEYTVTRAFRTDETMYAMVMEVPYRIALEGWRILRDDVEQLTGGERAQYEAFREITENFVAQCKTQGLVELVSIHTLPLNDQLKVATENLMRAYGSLLVKLNTIRMTTG